MSFAQKVVDAYMACYMWGCYVLGAVLPALSPFDVYIASYNSGADLPVIERRRVPYHARNLHLKVPASRPHPLTKTLLFVTAVESMAHAKANRWLEGAYRVIDLPTDQASLNQSQDDEGE